MDFSMLKCYRFDDTVWFVVNVVQCVLCNI